MDLLVSFPWHRYYPARREVRRVLHKLGDDAPSMHWTSVEGIAVVHTGLDPRQVVVGCRKLFCRGEEPFEFALKWVPVDEWCVTDLDAIKAVIEERIVDRIAPDETWGMQVEKRRWQKYHTAEIIEYLAPSIPRKVDLSNPDKILRIDVLGEQTAIALLRPDEIFSAITTRCPVSESQGQQDLRPEAQG